MTEIGTELPAALQGEFTGLVGRRGTLKGQVTRFHKFLTNVNQQISVSEIKCRLERIKELIFEFDDVQTRLENFDQAQNVEREIFENNYYGAIAIAQDLLSEYEDRTGAQTRTSNNNTAQQIQYVSNQANLQPLSVPQFSGSYEGWLTFFQIFKALVHDNHNLTKIQKFFHLQSSLKGEALQLLQALEVTEDNYEIAVELLKERYENKKVLIHNHVKNIWELPSVQKESYQSLRKLTDCATQNLRSLENLGEPVEYWDTLLIYLTMNCLFSLFGLYLVVWMV